MKAIYNSRSRQDYRDMRVRSEETRQWKMMTNRWTGPEVGKVKANIHITIDSPAIVPRLSFQTRSNVVTKFVSLTI